MSDVPVPVATDALKSLVDKLVPPREVRVTDLAGNEYTVPGVISARKNVLVVRHLQNVLGEPAVQRSIENLDAMFTGADIGAAIFHVIGIVSSEEVIGHLADAFACAHPDTLARAQRNATPDGHTFDPTADDLPDAADLFSVEELAGALVPLFVGLAKRSFQALNAVGGAL